MLRELSVQNLAVIEDMRVELEPGFCAWTGETGAGKSLLLGALGLLLGERGSVEWIRQDAEDLRVTGRFELEVDLVQRVESILDQKLDESEILLARRLHRGGRSQAYVNDQPVAVATLKALGSLLVDIHGQRESESLLLPAYQLELLDAYGQLEPAREHYIRLADQLRQLRKQYQAVAARQKERERELSLVRFEREELDQAELEPGELPELLRERERLIHAQSLQSFALQGYAGLYERDGSVIEVIGQLQRDAEAWIHLDARLQDTSARLAALATEVRDLSEDFREMGENWQADPGRLEEIERRLQLLRRLEAKYHKSLDELIVYRVQLDEREADLHQLDDNQETLFAEMERVFGELRQSATDLTRGRRQVASNLAAEAQRHLADLGMPEARLTATMIALDLGENPLLADIPAMGADGLELTLAANPGEPARPLRKVASGGELSRTMLALKSVLAGHDRQGTLVFDEIDANVGGRLGDMLGQKLAALGQTHQVICVTHLPQVASYARHHWTIRKTVANGSGCSSRHKNKGSGRTVTTIQRLADRDRLEELASMLRGEARGETTRQEALAMLDAARLCW